MAGMHHDRQFYPRIVRVALVLSTFILLYACTAYDPEPFATFPDVKTGSPVLVLIRSVVMSADVSDENGLAVKSRGFCWSSTNPLPTLENDTLNAGSGEGPYSDTITGLSGQTSYYIRAWATTNKGTGYGAALWIKTADTTVTDIDNNTYRVIQSGTLLWMAGNLKVTHFRNGDPIPEISGEADWLNQETGALCWYQNAEANKEPYGALYNWYSINDPRNLAPEGWHIALFQEWQFLITSLGGSATAGGKLKEQGIIHWDSPNTGATDEIGFTALPGGFRDGSDGSFKNIRGRGCWWTASASDPSKSRFYSIFNFSGSIDYDDNPLTSGFSVRCIKNNP
ncbi:MAG: fibrobacter succinogenes major paralogous domain-containing protein [bacterium]